MKTRILLPILVGLFLGSCGATSYLPRKVGENIVLRDEEEEYELIIIDNGFQSWFMSNAKPIWYYSPVYYENKNRQYVTSWNSLVSSTGGRGPFQNQINYDFNTDYGLKLNYQLYWYFRYVESQYGSFIL